jgi:hypothetical protein
MKNLIPWLVGHTDLRRYLGRALNECEKGRVIFVYFKPRGQGPLILLVSIHSCPELIGAAVEAFHAGRFKRVRLEALPRLNPKTGARTRSGQFLK